MQGQSPCGTYLSGSDVSLALYMQQPLHIVGVGLHVLHARGHTPLFITEGTLVLLFVMCLFRARFWGDYWELNRHCLYPRGL